MTDRNRRSPVKKTTQDEQNPPAQRDPYADTLAMPQEDDPGGDGHMWSGKIAIAEDQPEDELEVSTPGHLSTHPTGPHPF